MIAERCCCYCSHFVGARQLAILKRSFPGMVGSAEHLVEMVMKKEEEAFSLAHSMVASADCPVSVELMAKCWQVIALKKVRCSVERSDLSVAMVMHHFAALAMYWSETSVPAYVPSNHIVDKEISLHPIQSCIVDMSYYFSPPCAYSNTPTYFIQLSCTESNVFAIRLQYQLN